MDAYHEARDIVLQLTKFGHIAYFAGGWVRDYLMGHPSTDIDLATSASPSEILDLFPHTLLVGLSFGVVIVLKGGHQFEVATFRKDEGVLDGRRPAAISLSTPKEDASRRDFTINGMFFDPLKEEIHDYVQGQEDLKRGLIRTIGDPHVRFFEDRLRMLRAFRFSARFGFAIDPETQDAIRENASHLFSSVAPERVWQEFTKMVAYPRFDQALVEMHRLSLLGEIFPELAKLHVKELRHRVDAYSHYPSPCPTLMYLAEIMRELPLKEKIEIAVRLRAPRREIKQLEYLERLFTCFERAAEVEAVDWVALLAHADYPLGKTLFAARLSEGEREHFLKEQGLLYQKIASHVERMRIHRPLVSAAHLAMRGVLPGKEMGRLLRAAEKIAIEEDCQNSEEVLEKLFVTHPLRSCP